VLSYDHLIVAAGSTHSYFGHDEWSALAPGLKTLEDAFEIRKRILMAFERAERETDARRRQEWLTFTVIGGGATGVEMAGTLVEIARHTLSGEFRNIDPHSARVVLVEGSERVLAPIPGPVGESARAVAKAGVDVRTGCRVVHIDETCVRYANFDGEQNLATRTVIWSAGVAASPLGRKLGSRWIVLDVYRCRRSSISVATTKCL
jgi:NADH dehydrogenase